HCTVHIKHLPRVSEETALCNQRYILWTLKSAIAHQVIPAAVKAPANAKMPNANKSRKSAAAQPTVVNAARVVTVRRMVKNAAAPSDLLCTRSQSVTIGLMQY
ncbi:hypothetical protein XELAEV_18022532mg, partial [Xenopus laevis]